MLSNHDTTSELFKIRPLEGRSYATKNAIDFQPHHIDFYCTLDLFYTSLTLPHKSHYEKN